MRIALLTSNSLRHKYLAHALAAQLDLQLVINEAKSTAITATHKYSAEDAQFIKKHFQQRERSEKKYFGNYTDYPANTQILELPHGAINSREVKNKLEEKGIEYIVLFGTSIIRKELLKTFPGRIINFHLGLSPYYKGSATNLFPYYYNEPECIGGTIHLATPQVDQGGILAQFRPDIEAADDLHEIGNKVIVRGGKILPQVLKQYSEGRLNPIERNTGGKFCRNRDLKPDMLRSIYGNFEDGMIKEYLREKNLRDRQKPIILR